MILLTGAAGFIGFHVARRLLESGLDVVGMDDLNAYYTPALKRARLAELAGRKGFRCVIGDIAEEGGLQAAAPVDEVTAVIHLAAQAGVRHSLEAPFAYERANVGGHLRVLEYIRAARRPPRLVYASSSSVYGDRADGPFRETDRCDTPNSLYAATKRSCELMSETYARLFGLEQIGLRFFTAYGAWGRPDMAYWKFTEAVASGRPVTLYGDGRLLRDFTHIDDIAGAVCAIARAPSVAGEAPHTLYNLGAGKPCTVLDLVAAVEAALGRPAERIMAPAPPGDVTATFADISRAQARFGYAPKVSLIDGVADFVAWWRARAAPFTA